MWWWHMLLNPTLGRPRQADIWVWDQADLQIKFKDNQGNWETMSWKKIFFKVFIIFLKKPIYIATQLHGSQERTL